MKSIIAALAFVAVASVIAFADKPQPYDWDGSGSYITLSRGVERVADETEGLTRDTLTFPRLLGATSAHLWIVLDSTSLSPATDSMIVVKREVPYFQEVDASIACDTVQWITDNSGTETTTGILNWTPGTVYRSADLTLYSSDFWQFILLGSAGDTITYTVYLNQVIPGKE